MPGRILTLLLLALVACPGQARTATAGIARIQAVGVELRDVKVQLRWPAGAEQGELHIAAARIEAGVAGYRFRNVDWRCPVSRRPQGAWHCEGPLRADGAPPMRLALDLSAVTTDALLSSGEARASLHRNAAAPDSTELELTRVPIAWAQALLAQAWEAGRITGGRASGPVVVEMPAGRPLHAEARLAIDALSLESTDGAIAIGDLDARLHVDFRQPTGAGALVAVDGSLRGGELLYGNTYVALGGAPVRLGLDAMQRVGGGWDVPRLAWDDGDVLSIEGAGALAGDGSVQAFDVTARSRDAVQLPERYLSGWLGLAGLAGLGLDGAFELAARIDGGALSAVDATVNALTITDPRQRFRIDRLAGTLRHATGAAVDSELRWQGGALYELAFGPVRLPMRSEAGTLRLREAAELSMLGGQVRLDGFSLRPPDADGGLRIGFGLELDALDIGALAQALGWPAFRGTLSGRIPSARYADERLDFDGGLSMQVFDGRVDVDALSMERPFGVAPTLSADLALHDLDLLGFTEVFDFGSITGRLHGRVGGLRLVDWTATAFDAGFHTQPRPGVRQRISQRAVQDISSVGDASFVTSLQGRLIGLFDDFGYRRIGIACRLENEVCRMSGLHSAGAGFTIVEGAGVPKLQVVGFNRDVDWPTLLERLAAVASGDVAPVVD